MKSDETIAVIRLRQWMVDRAALRSSKTTNYKRIGWQRRDERSFDARQVRVLDFESAFNRLADEEKTALEMRYRENETAEQIAAVIGCSVRKIDYLVKRARHNLAETLDRLGLL